MIDIYVLVRPLGSVAPFEWKTLPIKSTNNFMAEFFSEIENSGYEVKSFTMDINSLPIH